MISDAELDRWIAGDLRGIAAAKIIRTLGAEVRRLQVAKQQIQDDALLIFRALDIGARPYSAHEAITRDAIPAIEQIQAEVRRLREENATLLADDSKATGGARAQIRMLNKIIKEQKERVQELEAKAGELAQANEEVNTEMQRLRDRNGELEAALEYAIRQTYGVEEMVAEGMVETGAVATCRRINERAQSALANTTKQAAPVHPYGDNIRADDIDW